MKIETFSAEETYKIGEQMGREAKAGDVLCLVGDQIGRASCRERV